MSGSVRVFKQDDISSDTGEVALGGLGQSPPFPAPGFTEWGIVNLRMRLTTHTADAAGLFLCTVRWNDGQADQEWDVSLAATEDATDPLNPIKNYTEVGMQIWADHSRNVTVQVKPLVAFGSIDVQIMGDP